MENPEVFYTPAEAARILRVSERTVKEHLRKGRLHGIKVGRLWRVPGSALSALERTPPRLVESSPLEAINAEMEPIPCGLALWPLVEQHAEDLAKQQSQRQDPPPMPA
jgi:excisionase family DNA binding protein